ncbi:MAG TPA: cytochrome BD quinol oxidase subunit I [Polyangiaceae bacterium]|nr:cytochrome BD quinol oxidase subunit I [Polyangiaceae bacterium]
MDTFVYYPPRDFGPLMKGLVIGGMGIFHVFLAQFAIGGGMLLTYFEWLHGRGRCEDGRLFLDGFFRILVLISFVVGAVTGVGMWFTSIQVSPRTIGRMVHVYHWIWAIEWTFFAVEVISGYTFYRYADRLPHRRRLQLLIIYSVAAWFSLFWINGILSWQLTPGGWQNASDVWTGFFNPSFWPSLMFRTVAAMATAALAGAAVINLMDVSRERRQALLRVTTHFLIPMVIMPVLGGWYLWSMPPDSRSWVLGGSPAMTLFFGAGVAGTALIALYAIVGMFGRRLYINGATALLLVALAFGATAGGEFVREGARKPFTIRQILYSNAIAADEVAGMREQGRAAADPYPLMESYPNAQLELGAKVYRLQCSVCHTMSGANGLDHLTGTWTVRQLRLNIAKLQLTKPFMPPFAGPAEELEALVQLLRWRASGQPASWPESTDPAVLEEIGRYLDEAGVEPGHPAQVGAAAITGVESRGAER